MQSENEKIVKLLQSVKKDLIAFEHKYVKELLDIKKYIKNINTRITEISSKIQEFEVMMDAAELINEQNEDEDDEENEYRTEWSPYDVEDEEFYNNDEDN